MDFTKLVVAGIPLVVVIFGLVEMVKSFGLSGNIVTIVSMAIGMVIGGGYSVYTNGVPVGFAGWFEAAIFGIALGLVASGFYKFTTNFASKVAALRSK